MPCFRRSDNETKSVGEMRYHRQRDLYIGGYGRLLSDGAPYVLLTVENPPKYKGSERWRLEAFAETVALCVYRKLAGSAETAGIAHGLCGVKGMLLDLNARAMFAERADAAPITAEERSALRRFWVVFDDEPVGDTYRVQCDTIGLGELRGAAAAAAATAAKAATFAPGEASSSSPPAPPAAPAAWEPTGKPPLDPLDDQELLRAYMLTSETLAWTFVGALAALAYAMHCGVM